jgi:hypothetical protein
MNTGFAARSRFRIGTLNGAHDASFLAPMKK